MSLNHSVTSSNEIMIADTLEEVRSISRNLHPIHLEKFGLTATLIDTLEKVEKSSNLFVSKEIDEIDDLLKKESEIQLFRIIQEALNNIIKHAEATAIKLSIQKNKNDIEVKIQDNGKGFNIKNVQQKSESLGLRTMRERIATIGGSIEFKTPMESGTAININIPIKKY